MRITWNIIDKEGNSLFIIKPKLSKWSKFFDWLDKILYPFKDRTPINCSKLDEDFYARWRL